MLLSTMAEAKKVNTEYMWRHGTKHNTGTMLKIFRECHRKGQGNNPLIMTGNVMHSFPSMSLLIHDS